MKLYFIVTLVLIYQNTLGQNLNEDYIITQNGEKLNGEFDPTFTNNYNVIRFMPEGTNMFTDYNPKDILEYKSKSGIYESSFKYDNYSDPFYMQSLYNGIKSLYFVKSPGGKNTFYIIDNNKLILLESERRKSEFDGDEETIMISNKYKNQLKVYLNNCSIITDHFNITKYSKNSLLKLFYTYYECIGAQAKLNEQILEQNYKLELIVGISNIQFNFPIFKHTENYVSPHIGFAYETTLPGSQSFSIRNEITFNKFLSEKHYPTIKTVEEIQTISNGFIYEKTILETPNDSRYNCTLVSVNILPSYKISNLSKIVFGLTNTFGWSKDSPRDIFKSYLDEELSYTKDLSPQYKFYSPGFLIGYGSSFKKTSVYITYNYIIGPYTDYAKREDSNSSNLNKINLYLAYNFH